ncbi:ABC transporter ATP-binding protein [Phyllobacterium zundukense]|uniref:ABC transporter ATP-binding protein n=1 Tax=Phyllobacterium zundukense TaxID=1867719 RepID=A0ACD4CVA4_9HYPH|nr:ABC transporter ATP-binding protein [Phyllobacterium zundukense]UXN57422.1 ABC transporter ATP-binding protein [Phyllobacterium zundukense]
MSVQVRQMVKSFGAFRAIDDLSVTFQSGKISVMLGASGCGKTTTLRCIAGLENPNGGEIRIEDEPVFSSARGIDLPPEKRRLGMVFQSYAVWPHLTVRGNVGMPLRAQKVPKEQIERRVQETLAIVGLSEQADKSAMKLSGGQQQRVSIARCLVGNPRLILMDEPLSNLDARLRVEMRNEIRQLQQRIGATILFVTHDQEEAMSLADEIFLFNKGKVEQQGSPEDLYFRPAARYVAEFLGKANLFPVTLRGEADQTAVYAANSDHLIAKGDIVRQSRDDEALCMIRPESWQIGAAEGDRIGLPATVLEAVFVGDRRELHVDTPIGRQIVVTPGHQRFSTGARISLTIAPQQIHLLPDHP